MALTVRPDDEVYQFDTVWLGPDEYTLPIQARYVAWGTWLACFLVAAVVLIPLGGDGPAAVFGSLIWALGLSVVLSRAVMLVVDHERPLRSLPALFSSEARAALQARRRAERTLLIRPGKVLVRETPPKVLALRERQRSRTAARVDRRQSVPAEAPVAVAVAEPEWTPDAIEYLEPTPAWSVPSHDVYESDADTYRPVPVTYGAAYPATPHLTAPPEPVATPDRYEPAPLLAHHGATRFDPGHPADRNGTSHHGPAHHADRNGTSHHGPAHPADLNGTSHHGPAHPADLIGTGRPADRNGTSHHGPADHRPGDPDPGQRPYGTGTGAGRHSVPESAVPVVAAAVPPRPNPFRTDPHHPDDPPAPYRGPVTVSPTDGRHARARHEAPDGQAAIEARILLPARKDR